MNSPAPTRSLFLVPPQCPITSSYTSRDESNLLAITEVTLLKRQFVLELLLLLGAVRAPSAHLPDYLAEAEARELNLWLADDIHIAWLTVWFASKDYADPWGYAFWHYLGRHPAKLIPEFVARSARHAAMEAGAAVSLACPFEQSAPPLPPQSEKEMPCQKRNAKHAETALITSNDRAKVIVATNVSTRNSPRKPASRVPAQKEEGVA